MIDDKESTDKGIDACESDTSDQPGRFVLRERKRGRGEEVGEGRERKYGEEG